MREQVLSAARVHERVKPGHDEGALQPRGFGRAVEDREAQRRLAAGIDRGVELGLELGVKRSR